MRLRTQNQHTEAVSESVTVDGEVAPWLAHTFNCGQREAVRAPPAHFAIRTLERAYRA